MGEGWPLVPLSEVLAHRKHFIEIDDTQEYRRCRVQLHAQGVVLRDVVSGSAIRTKSQQVCRAGEFLVAEIDAKLGGYGLVPEELDGAIVSSHYFLFEIDASRLDRRYLGWFSKTAAFFDQVSAQGSTNYAAIRPAHVLGYLMPLPPIEEQRRIVARVEAIAGKIEEAQRLRASQRSAALGILRAVFDRITADVPKARLADVAPLIRRPVRVTAEGEYAELGVRSFGRGTFHKPPLRGNEVGSKKLYEIRAGDLVFNIVFAWEGAIAVAKAEDEGRVGSHRFLTFVPKQDLATAPFLSYYFLTPEGLAQVSAASPGGAGRNRTLGLKAAGAMTVPLPPIRLQHYFDELQEQVARFERQSAANTTALEAILPSVLDRAFRGEL
jgi:type I restriction enzyme S subunit